MNNELRKNAEGYTDPTAAATLTRKEAGDIWEYKSGECLVVKGHAGYATILRLHDSNQYGDRVKVAERDDGPRYVDPSFVITGRYSEMGQYVETLDVVTFERVIEAVENTLAIDLPRKETANTEKADAQEAAELREQLTIALEHIKVLESLKNMDKAELTTAHNAATKAKNQLELLRDMYNELLAKVVEEKHG